MSSNLPPALVGIQLDRFPSGALYAYPKAKSIGHFMDQV